MCPDVLDQSAGMRLTLQSKRTVVLSDRVAARAVRFLQSCTALEGTPSREELCTLAVGRIIDSLCSGESGPIRAWYATPRPEDDGEMTDILRAACHAVAYGFERHAPGRLPDALAALDLIECELTQDSASRRCAHDHDRGIANFRRIA